MKFELGYYLAVFRRRFFLFLLVFSAAFAFAVAAAVLLPTVYQASARLLVEPSLIPGELASSTVQTDPQEQFQIIQQRLYSRSAMLDLANKLEIGAENPNQTPDELVRRMRESIVFLVQSGGRGRATLISIDATSVDASEALDIANEVVTYVLQEDTAFRTEMASQTLSFFENEAERLGQELDQINSAILAFQNENVGALPEGSEFRFTRQAVLQERLSQIRRERNQLGAQRARLLEVFEETGQVRTSVDAPLSQTARELQSLRAELNNALAIFSENNPQVRVLRARIAQLEALEQTNSAPQEEPTTGTTMLDIQLAEIAARSAELDEQIDRVESEMTVIEDAIRATPANAIALDGLQRNYDNVSAQYNAAVERLSTAATGERIEILSKGQRVSIVEQAILPREPVSPNRKLIVGGGFVVSTVLGLAAIILTQLMGDSVQRPSDLTRALGVTPLATIPYVDSPFEKFRERLFWALVIVGIACAGLVMILFLRNGMDGLEQLMVMLRATFSNLVGGE